jgi:Na+-translocating ferredoxin:NAD+ oxidoreductase subunit B
MAEMGIANVVARSPFVNQVDQDLCIGCEDCVESCQFGALILNDGFMTVNEMRCVGCGVCVTFCNEGALSLTRRSEDEIMVVPVDEREWGVQRSKERGVNIEEVL